MLVAFKNCKVKDEILANMRNQQQPIEKFTGISVSHNLPPPRKGRKYNAKWRRQNTNMSPMALMTWWKTTDF